MIYIPTRPSYTNPKLGEEEAGDIIWFVQIAISSNSIFARSVYGTKIFISSPSKSALYGVDIATLN